VIRKPFVDIMSRFAVLASVAAASDVSGGVEEFGSFQEIADHVNSLGTSWTAAAPTRFGEIEDVKKYLGTVMRGDEAFVEMENDMSEVPNVDIPADFDVRTAFPDCAEVSGNIRDQSDCGSCWAFGSTEAFNDRHCIATGDKTKLSVEDTTANCGFLQCFSMGCNGGQPGQAWQWFKKKGVVTGGDYFDIGAGDTCAPYSLKPCAHHVPATEKYPACPSSEYDTPSLKACSESGYGKSYANDKIKASDAYSLSGIQAIQADMVQYGSATAAFTVYEDFPTYKSGVYKHTTGKQLGGHAIKLLGWGTENGEDYWLVANSWNEEWGDNGTFKIARGSNECGIEGQVSAGRAGSSILA
jgi:cathepsin B